MGMTLGAIGTGLAALSELLGSRARLQQASFRGVPFLVNTAGGAGGRHLVTHEFPLRDIPSTEDMGRAARHFRLHAFVVDPLPGTLLDLTSGSLLDGNLSISAPLGYMDQRDNLIEAIEASNTAALLVHPTMGAFNCRAGLLQWSEHIVERFGYCEFQLEFVVDGPQPSPVSGDDTISSLLGGVASALPLISAAYETVVLGIVSPGALLGMAAGTMLGLPAGTIQGLQNAIEGVSATPTDLVATAVAVQSVIQAMAAQVIAAQPVPTGGPTDPVLGVSLPIPAPSDFSGGLALLASWGSTFPPIVGIGAPAVTLAAQQAAVIALVQGNALAAMVQIYAAADWPDADAAAAARMQLVQLLDVQTDAAAAAGQDDLYRAWQALTALVIRDLLARAQALPQRTPYAVGASLPSLALAQLLYQDASRADELELLNTVPQPLFMLATGVALLP